ncbi:MAG TPA: hypothetical protein VJ865_04370, partial [Gemmatimonadaceae bacterium]|nr:hypothetical protein [Gemmatimonadaceae bacterium]
EQPVAPSSGFPGTQLVNAGKISKHGNEIMLRATPIANNRTSWDLTFSTSTNHTNVDNLGARHLSARRRTSGTPSVIPLARGGARKSSMRRSIP